MPRKSSTGKTTRRMDAPRRKREASPALTHVDARGAARMVDVGEKKESAREACAEAWVLVTPEALAAVRANAVAKGDVLSVARVAGIQGAKRAHDLIPLCHPLKIVGSGVEFQLVDAPALPSGLAGRHGRAGIRVEAVVRAFDRTGVEMEALAACMLASLTIYDMLKALDKGMVISGARLLRKTGGKSGDYVAPADDREA